MAATARRPVVPLAAPALVGRAPVVVAAAAAAAAATAAARGARGVFVVAALLAVLHNNRLAALVVPALLGLLSVLGCPAVLRLLPPVLAAVAARALLWLRVLRGRAAVP